VLTFVTGLSGSGKSTLCDALVERGLQAFDTDDGMARWQHRATGRFVPDRPSGGATAVFLADHDWVVPRPSVEALRELPGRVWLCGGIGNDTAL
jgi:adenylate kinase family enzyme